MGNRPTLGGYFELLGKVFTAMVALIFWGALAVAVVMAAPFLLSLLFVMALVGAGAFVFSWEYVWVGAMFFLVLFAVAFE